jgi:Domain of unknown function (DUF1707)
MDTPAGDFQRGAIRLSDAERDQAVTELSEHYQAGRLTLEEFGDRSDRALRARTGSDLSVLFTDLPKTTIRTPGAPVSPAVPACAGRRRAVGRRAGRPITARAVIALVIALLVLGNVAGGVVGGFSHQGLGWLVPVAVLCLVFLRLSRHR